MAHDKGLDNVAVHWPRTNQYYDPVAPAEFVDFGAIADAPEIAAPTGALALHIAKTGTVRATAYTELVDLLLGLGGVLYAKMGMKRSVLVSLTDAGAALRDRAGEVPLEISRALGLTATQTTQLRDLLQRVCANAVDYAESTTTR